MSYNSIADIAESGSLRRRLIACAADEDKSQPDAFIAARIWTIATSPGWAAAWDSALAAGLIDPGVRNEVITDGMILAVIQPMQ